MHQQLYDAHAFVVATSQACINTSLFRDPTISTSANRHVLGLTTCPQGKRIAITFNVKNGGLSVDQTRHEHVAIVDDILASVAQSQGFVH